MVMFISYSGLLIPLGSKNTLSSEVMKSQMKTADSCKEIDESNFLF